MVLADAALRTLKGVISAHPFYVDCNGEWVSVSRFKQPATFGIERWIELAQAALADLYEQVPRNLPSSLKTCALRLVVPPANRPGVPEDLASILLKKLPAGPLKFHDVRIVHGDHAAAIKEVQRYCNTSANRGPLVLLTVDSWLHSDSLLWLECQNLLHGAGKKIKTEIWRNPYGRIPGEGAAAILIADGVQGWCQIKGCGSADERVLRTDDIPCTGLGWTNAARQALSTLPLNQQITHIMTDLNGEMYRADQFGFTTLRLGNRLKDGWERYTPSLVTGDLGTATSLVHMALSASFLKSKEYWEGAATHLLLSCSDDALRGAIILSANTNL